MRSTRATAAALVLLVTAAILPVATLPAAADQGEGATATVNDQERRMAVGALHACSILDSGAVQCWGNNDQGQLGNGTRSATTSPVTVTGVSAAIAITAGAEHTCALIYGAGRRYCRLSGESTGSPEIAE